MGCSATLRCRWDGSVCEKSAVISATRDPAFSEVFALRELLGPVLSRCLQFVLFFWSDDVILTLGSSLYALFA